jgi:transcriptional regulator GlxA family with amidase domain
MTANRTRHVVMVAFPRAQVLDVTGPLEVFSQATRHLRRHDRGMPAYTTEIVARRAGMLTTSSGMRLIADRSIADVRGHVDTLLVAGGVGTADAMRDDLLLAWLRRMAKRVRRLGAVCSGTFVLAEAGLLATRRATTHWELCGELAQRYPDVTVEEDPIFVRDGSLYTSAGVTAGMDLALALVEEDHGREIALAVARQLVLFLQRPGGQSQFSAQLAAQSTEREPLRALQAWIFEHLDEDLSVPALAHQAAMSERNFSRVFAREVGTSPAQFVLRARIEAARRRLEESTDGVDKVAADCGFASAEVMRRAFLRRLRVAPSAYRARFRPAARASDSSSTSSPVASRSARRATRVTSVVASTVAIKPVTRTA